MTWRVNGLRVAERSRWITGISLSPRLAPDRVTYVRNPKGVVIDPMDDTARAEPHEPQYMEIIPWRPAADVPEHGPVRRIRVGPKVLRGRRARRRLVPHCDSDNPVRKAPKPMCLSCGTSPERIAAESLTRGLFPFVHGDISRHR